MAPVLSVNDTWVDRRRGTDWEPGLHRRCSRVVVRFTWRAGKPAALKGKLDLKSVLGTKGKILGLEFFSDQREALEAGAVGVGDVAGERGDRARRHSKRGTRGHGRRS